jgi:hypothetical protein
MTLKWEKRSDSKCKGKDCGKKDEIGNFCPLTCVKHTMFKGVGGGTMCFNGGGSECNVSVIAYMIYCALSIVTAVLLAV